jgi:hypothetical protein
MLSPLSHTSPSFVSTMLVGSVFGATLIGLLFSTRKTPSFGTTVK